jgi:DNA-binding XRE family transcriptional regulator
MRLGASAAEVGAPWAEVDAPWAEVDAPWAWAVHREFRENRACIGRQFAVQRSTVQCWLVLLGFIFASLRRSHGYSQRALAPRCGLSQSSISRFEAGKAPWLTARYLARMLSALEIAPAELAFTPGPIRSPARDWLVVAIEAANDAGIDGDR